jgi:hypothetical protein
MPTPTTDPLPTLPPFPTPEPTDVLPTLPPFPTSAPRATSTPKPYKAPTFAPGGPTVNYIKVDAQTLDTLNPLTIENSPYKADFSKPGPLLTRTMTFLFPLTGAFLFGMLVWAGFEMMGTAATKKSIDTGKQRAFAALRGYIYLFLIYWGVQIIEFIFKIKILN